MGAGVVGRVTDYHKHVEAIRQEIERLHAHVDTTAHILRYHRELRQRAFEHM